MLDRSEETDSSSEVLLVRLLGIAIEVEVPELDVELGVGADGGDEDVTTLGGPEDRVGRLVVERLCAKLALVRASERGESVRRTY